MTNDPHVIARQLVERLETAWNGADGDNFGEPFASDADFVDIRGTHHKGRYAIGAGHQAIFDSIYRGNAIRYSVDSVRLIDSNTLLAHGSVELDAPSGPLQGTSQATCSLVATATNSRWEIASFHNTLVSS